jgi:hypothetical protein
MAISDDITNIEYLIELGKTNWKYFILMIIIGMDYITIKPFVKSHFSEMAKKPLSRGGVIILVIIGILNLLVLSIFIFPKCAASKMNIESPTAKADKKAQSTGLKKKLTYDFDDAEYHGWECKPTGGGCKFVSEPEALKGKSIKIVNSACIEKDLPEKDFAGKTIKVIAWIKTQGIKANSNSRTYEAGKFHIAWNDSKGDHWAPEDHDFYSENVGENHWLQMEREAVIPVDARNINIFMGIQGNTGTLYIDDISIEVF